MGWSPFTRTYCHWLISIAGGEGRPRAAAFSSSGRGGALVGVGAGVGSAGAGTTSTVVSAGAACSTGAAAAGLGSAIYDIALGGYSFFDALITFVSKFAMAWVTGILYKTWVLKKEEKSWKENLLPLIISCVLGALTYVALYMLKTWLFKLYVEPVPVDTIPGIMVAKLGPSLINAVFAIVTVPIFFHAVRPALKAGGILKQLETIK